MVLYLFHAKNANIKENNNNLVAIQQEKITPNNELIVNQLFTEFLNIGYDESINF